MSNTTVPGEIIGIYMADSPGAPLHAVESAQAIPGRGLQGARFYDRTGALVKSGKPVPPKMELSMIESEGLESLRRDYGIQLDHSESRRDLVTRGVALNHLVGVEFSIGPVRARGIKMCEPCDHLEGLTQKGVRSGLIHRGGL